MKKLHRKNDCLFVDGAVGAMYLLKINKYSVENSKRKNIKLTLNQVVQNYLTLFSN